jgi:hypothetical protein
VADTEITFSGYWLVPEAPYHSDGDRVVYDKKGSVSMKLNDNVATWLAACSLLVSIVILLCGNNILGRIDKRIVSIKQDTDSLKAEAQSLVNAQRIQEAREWIKADNPQGRESALRLLREVVASLPPEKRQSLDATLLAEAETDFRNQHYDDALRKYQSLLSQGDLTDGGRR